MKLNISSLLFIIFFTFIVSISYGQYANDPCELTFSSSGYISTKESVPATCWKIVPPTKSAYLVNDITVTLINASIPTGNVIKFIGGSNILSKDPIITFNNGTYTSIGEPISTDKGLFIIFLDGDNANVTTSFSVIFTSTPNETHLKPSVVGLLSVAVAFAVPFVVFTVIRCLIPNSTSKDRSIKIKKGTFWVSFILGLVFLAMILSRKVV